MQKMLRFVFRLITRERCGNQITISDLHSTLKYHWHSYHSFNKSNCNTYVRAFLYLIFITAKFCIPRWDERIRIKSDYESFCLKRGGCKYSSQFFLLSFADDDDVVARLFNYATADEFTRCLNEDRESPQKKLTVFAQAMTFNLVTSETMEIKLRLCRAILLREHFVFISSQDFYRTQLIEDC